MKEPDLLSRVRQECRAQHQRLEALLPFHESLTLADYRKVLILFWGLFLPMEEALRKAEVPPSLDLCQRQRAPLLARDLAAMGMPAEALTRLPRCPDIPPVNTTARALGCMYVLEGSTLGGQFIAKLARQRLGLTETSGCAFFFSHGEEVGRMWQSFCATVREHVLAPAAQQDFIATAANTFSTFVRWLEENHDER
jgi:heme oxygenase